MKKMKWLIRREFWEHDNVFVRAPLVGGLCMIVLIGVAMGLGMVFNKTFSITIDGNELAYNGVAYAFPGTTRDAFVDALAGTYMELAVPLFMMLGLILFFYCLNTLYDERRDRSVLFWKSLPLSDRITVLSKVITALGVAPTIMAVAGIVTATLLAMFTCAMAAYAGVPVLASLCLSSKFYLAPLQVLALLPLYVLWALPSVGWLLLVSAWARSKAFLWAIGGPAAAFAVVRTADFYGMPWNADWFLQNVIGHWLGGLMPGAWLVFDHVPQGQTTNLFDSHFDMTLVFEHSWQLMGSAQPWVGAVLGMGMIAAAIRMRHWRLDQ